MKKLITTKIKNWKVISIVLAAFVVGLTTYSLVMPATALDEETAQDLGGIELNTDAEAASGTSIIGDGGKTYDVQVAFGKKSDIPEEAELVVDEIPASSEEYDEYVAKTEEALGSDGIGYIRLFDISIVKDGEKVQPAEGETVDVKIKLDDAGGKDLNVVHFADSRKKGDVIEAKTDGKTVTFETESFSVYSISEEFTTPTYENPILNIEEDTGYYLFNGSGTNTRYLLNTVYADANPNGLRKTADRNFAELFYFEEAEGDNNYYIYTLVDGQKKYLYFDYVSDNDASLKLSDSLPDSPMTVTNVGSTANGSYNIAGTALDGNNNPHTYYINQHGGTSGARFAGYYKGGSSSNGDDGGSRISISKPATLPDDALGLNGKSFGLINFQSDISGYALMADPVNNSRLQRKKTLIKENPLDHEGRVFIAEGADVPMWTFHAVEGDVYYMTTEIDGAVKFLSVTGGRVSLVDALDHDACDIRIEPGTGSNTGKLKFIATDGSLLHMHASSNTNGFGTSTSAAGANDYMNLAVKENLNDDDFVPYSAEKVSVSDEVQVPDGKQIIIYTRSWNDTTKEYEFYAIDYNGSLTRVYENGDEIKWVGTKVNTLLWNFIEYRDEQTGGVNYYYDFQNDYSGKYLAPAAEDDAQIILSDTVGVNLAGRRNGKYSTTILAWDDPEYNYKGLKVENGQLVICPISEAQEFYFAIMDKEPDPDQGEDLTTVKTVDNNDFGITMKIIDINGEKTNDGSFDKTQTDVMGSTGNDKGLVNPYLDENGYPTATKTGTNLSVLYNGATDANHLFLQSIYNESGYFEYNCTENFAHYDQETGNFVVYNQVGTIETDNKSLDHGQFMPYNDLDPNMISEKHQNTTDEVDNPLSYHDPRKDKTLYTIPYNKNKPQLEDNNADYHFGMEMTASFTQTASGEDAWGHDIIFEFAGDDDMFLFVDGVLILDLGGIHAAQTGKVNFKTGQVTSSKGNSNLLNLFKASFTAQYKAEHPDWTQTELNTAMNEWLDQFFQKDSRGNFTTVFKDYTSHEMRMIYMERGAGASNLHMRFNLAAVKPGTVMLGKKLSGIDPEDTVPSEFPYQIWVKVPGATQDEWRLLGSEPGDRDLVKYENSTRNVKYEASYNIAGAGTYEHVFFLQPDEYAEITLPEDTMEYRIVECGVNPDIYDVVKVNDTEIEGTAIEESEKKDFKTEDYDPTKVQTVTYDNHIKQEALRTLTFTKTLWDVAGDQIHYEDNDTTFNFRLAFGNDNETSLTLANMQPYHVKDPNGNYCRYDSATQKFVSLGKTVYSQLTAAEKEAATFHTSPNGSISRIPVDHQVEVRQILSGTKYQIVERDYEVPEGYSWKGYRLNDEAYEGSQAEGIKGTIPSGSETDPRAEIQNYKGWGLRINKIWSDADFVSEHDTIYLALFTKAETTGDETAADLTLIEGTVRAMPTGSDSIYWYLDKLFNGADFDHHVIREVTLSEANPEIDAEGRVTHYGTATPVVPGGTMLVGATPIISGTPDQFTYEAAYEMGQMVDDNIRKDTVTNSRPGIRIVKTDWAGNKLANAVFTLKDGDGRDVGQTSYTSDASGLVTLAYLPDGTFTLTETKSPVGFAGLFGALTIEKDGDRITLEATDSRDVGAFSYTEATSASDPVITVKDRPFELKAVKIDSETSDPLAGVHFTLYRQVRSTGGALIKDYNPVAGYEDLVTDESGTIPQIDQSLPAGTYYLEESQALPEYRSIADLVFTISDLGQVSIEHGTDRSIDLLIDASTGAEKYTITLKNTKATQKVRFKKVDLAYPSTEMLAGAEFDLYGTTDGVRDSTPLYSGLVSGADGIMVYTEGSDSIDTFELPVGVYHLVETKAPAGYILREDAVIVTVTSTEVTYDEGTSLSESGAGRVYDAQARIYTLTVSNTSGVELPSSGGIGTTIFYVLGSMLLLLSGGALVVRRRLL